LLDEAGQRVVSASPAALERGVSPGISRWEAEQRCPDVMIAEPEPEKYEYFWQQAVSICGDYAPDVHVLGIHAISLDLTGTERLLGSPKSIASEIRNRLRVEVGLAASVGVGPNRLVARLACESASPGGVVEVAPEEAAEFVGRLPILALPGVDHDWSRRLSDMGIRRAKDLAALPADAVQRALGAWGRSLWDIARGEDPQRDSGSEAASSQSWEKGLFSVQADVRPATDDRERIRSSLREVAEAVARRLRRRGQVAQQIKVTLVFGDMRRIGARRTLRQGTRSSEAIFQAVWALFSRMKVKCRPVRRLRIGVGRLVAETKGGQLGLPLLEQRTRRDRLAGQIDGAKDRFGESAVARASSADALAR
jgi:DNA polymerase-4